MLEGLEIKEVKLNKIINTNLIRLEPEFYTAKSFDLDSPFSGEEIIDFVQYGTSKELNEEFKGYPVLRLNEFKSCFISKPSKYCNKINQNTYDSLRLLKNDVLICRTNGNYKYVGKSAIVPKDYNYAYASYLFKIRPKNHLINASTLVTYLNSKYGRIEIEKYSMAGNQVNFSPAKFRQLRIPKFIKEFNVIIEKLTYKSFEHLQESDISYIEADEVLSKEIGLLNFKPSNSPINIKSFSESLGMSKRLDAEYYQPKYDDYLKLIFNYHNGFDSISDSCNLKGSNYNPIDEKKYNYIELSNIDKSGDISGCTIDLGNKLPSRARRLVNKGDLIISSIEGSLDSCALVTENYNNSLCSTGFYVINSSKINSETLLVLFKSELMQNILKQNCSGTILTAINKDEFLNIPIPQIQLNIQQQISELIESSFSNKRKSEYLLNVTKKAVEMAIEQNEQIALKYINEKISDYAS
ncbi:restriction endonuclease subunit S [Aquimarina sp. Aq107]|uniref:restriction endonuclease subunit S n=1 Tax=Aquimarina sp. Aq107 TaxID=1191912 RepID=UPI000D54B40D|nr:restriction endonuclease subunit S [Aquimarina sp. Aq107]